MLESLLSLFLHSVCPLCQRPAKDLLCQYCQKQIQFEKLKQPCQYWQGDLPLFAWGIYRRQLKRAIGHCKYNSCPELGEMMGYWLGAAWLDSPLGERVKKLTLVPIPLSSNKLEQRGFNQAESIARGFSKFTGYPIRSRYLKRVRPTEAMFGLSVGQRRKNLEGAFAMGEDFRGSDARLAPVLLIDDIYTTGTTVKEAAKLLRARKVEVFGVAVVAFTPLDSYIPIGNETGG